MSGDDEFTPRTGRIRSRGSAASKRYLNRVQAALRATGRDRLGSTRGSFSGTRIGRGAGVGHVSAARNPFVGQRGRRVIVKVNIARAKSGGAGALRAHVHYIQRDGVERDGSPGALYDRASDEADGKEFVERSGGDRHQFRLIVSPEDADELGDLKSYTRELMTRAERDLGTRLDWVAADHFNTGNPHTHIVIRGRETSGKDLVIAKDYIAHGFRRRGSEIATEELGPRRDNEIAMMRKREVGKERFTGFDRDLADLANDSVVTLSNERGAYGRFRRALLIGRLQKLERLGLARAKASNSWRLSGGMEPALRRLGTRGDIINTMAHVVGNRSPDFAIFDPGDCAQKKLTGRIVASGGSDELRNGRYLILEATDGRTWHVDVGAREPGTLPSDGAIVEIGTRRAKPKQADRTIAEIASRNEGAYSDALHAEHDPSATAAYRLAHKRRLEALRRSGIVARGADDNWRVPDDYLERAKIFEARRASGVRMQVLSWLPLEQLVERDAATWLDVRPAGQGTAARGFGSEIEAARVRRRAWLAMRGIENQKDGTLSTKQQSPLRDSEIATRGRALERKIGKRFKVAATGDHIEGRFTRITDLAAGRFAVIEKSKQFTLVPWRDVLERQRGQSITGIVRASGVNWKIDRNRGRSI